MLVADGQGIKRDPMPGFISDSPLARDLIHIWNDAIAREDAAALRAYFAQDYVFHVPGVELSFDQLNAYFVSRLAGFQRSTCP